MTRRTPAVARKPQVKDTAHTRVRVDARSPTDKTLWRQAYRALPGSRAVVARGVKDARSFAAAAFGLPSALQVGWKGSIDGLLDELESRFAPHFYIAHQRKGGQLIVWREEQGRKTRHILGKQADAGIVVGTIAELVNLVALSLVPLNDGDDLHFIMVTLDTCTRLKKLLGSRFEQALHEERRSVWREVRTRRALRQA